MDYSLLAEQTADQILASCPLYHPPYGTLGLAALDDDTVDWLKRTALTSDDNIVQTKKKSLSTKQQQSS